MQPELTGPQQKQAETKPGAGIFSGDGFEALALPLGIGYKIGQKVALRYGPIPGIISGVASVLISAALLQRVGEGRVEKFLESAGIKIGTIAKSAPAVSPA